MIDIHLIFGRFERFRIVLAIALAIALELSAPSTNNVLDFELSTAPFNASDLSANAQQ